MDTFISLINSKDITLESAIFKMLMAVIAGGIIGMNREQHKQPAGFRTHILICMGATLLMMLSIYIPQVYFDFKNGDPGRIAAQVVSGIGFLGAGAIIRMGTSIRGITTAASIWLISAVGLCIGAGMFVISFVTVVFALFTLVILGRIEQKYFPQMHIKNIVLEFNDKHLPDNEIHEILNKFKIHMSDFAVTTFTDKGNFTELKIVAKIPETIDLSKLLNKLNKLESLQSVKIS